MPFPPGGGTDAVARILANRLSEVWGQQMVIENKGGAGGNIALEMVARSDPDGYTVLITALPLAVNRYLYRLVSYDPVADFAPVTLICLYPNLMVVPNSSPAQVGQRIHRPRQGQSGQDHLRLVRHRHLDRICPASCSSAWPASR